MKVCKKCKILKPEQEYTLKGKLRLDGSPIRASRCKACYNEYHKKFYQANKENIIKRRLLHKKSEESIENRRQYLRSWEKKKKETDPKFRALKNLRQRHWLVFKGKIRTTENLGCNTKELKDYIESIFTPGMNWDNYGFGDGKWVIDHIIPVSMVELDINGNVLDNKFNHKLVHYTNLQPLWFLDNARKSNKWNPST